MKKIKLLIITIISMFILPGMVSAASGKITISGTSTTVVGNKVTVTVKLSAGASWEMNLNYDKNYLQLVSGGGEANGTRMVNTSSGKPNRTYTFTFKTLKKGSTTVKVGSYYIIDDNFNEMDISAGSKTIKIITQEELEASYSKDNNLKSLEVSGYELNETFNKDILNYSVNVPEGTTSINVSAISSDSKASVSGDGEIEVSEGINNLSIVVRAENGSEKTYNLLVNVIDQNPINISIDNINYTVIKLRQNYICPELFEESEITINEFQIPVCINKNINYTLVGLKKEDGEVDNFIYNNGKYTKYNELVGTSQKIIQIDYKNEIEGLTKTKEKINDLEYQVFKFSENSKSYVIYGMNVETGEKDFYVYDTKNKTFSSYDREHIDYLLMQNKTYIYIILIFGGCLLLSLICVIYLISSKKKLKKKHKNKEINKNIKEKREIEDVNELKEIINNDEEEINLFESSKNKKKKKK